MISLTLKKVYYTEKEGLKFVDEDNKVEHLCEDQTFSTLNTGEEIIIKVDKVPFITFKIIRVDIDGDEPAVMYRLISLEPVSLKTYQIIHNTFDVWGDYKEIGMCIDKAISVVAGFIYRMGKEDTNDGNYYKNDDWNGCSPQ